MGTFVARRAISLVAVMFVVGVISFLLIHLAPGDPASFMLGPDATQEQVEQLRRALGLDEPLLVQFARWLGRAVQGDLGSSIFLGSPSVVVIKDRLEPTLLLTGMAALISLIIGVPAGIAAARRRNTLTDQALMTLSVLGLSAPSFWLALNLLLLFGLKWRWFPVAGYRAISEVGFTALWWLVLPAFTLGFINAGLLARLTRSAMLEIFGNDFVRTARAKGLSEQIVTYRHVFRNALIPVVTVFGNTVGTLMGGAIVTETVFAIPGIGRLVVQAVLRRDYPLLQAVVLFTAAVYVVTNFLIDVAYTMADPRIRYE